MKQRANGGEARRASRFAPGIESFKWMPDGRRIEEWELYRGWLADREKDGRRN